MNESLLQERLGSYLPETAASEPYQAFVPALLPFTPALDMSRLYGPLDRATKALCDMDAFAKLLPDKNLFLYMYVRKEALFSSQIEGTQSSLSDLLLFESDETFTVPIDDVQEVSNYITALQHGIDRLKENFPLSSRLIREMHAHLLSNGRGANKEPGEFRRAQNWIGGPTPGRALFVPPPPRKVEELIGNLEQFLHTTEPQLPVLIKAAIVHVQFETIHPFLDGNGRLGRLLITLILYAEGMLTQPTLYLSLYLKQNRTAYYDLLQKVRTTGAWEEWCGFLLKGIEETASQAVTDAKRIIDLMERDRERILHMGKAAHTALKIHRHLFKHPYLSLTKAAKALELAVPTATRAVMKLVEMGILKEATGKARNRLFAYVDYIDILAAGTEPLEK